MGRRSKRREPVAPAPQRDAAAPAPPGDELAPPPSRHFDWVLLVGLVLWAPSAYRWVDADLSATAAGVRLAAALAFAHCAVWFLRTLVAGYLPPPPGGDDPPAPAPDLAAAGPPQRRASDPADADLDPFAWDPGPEPDGPA